MPEEEEDHWSYFDKALAEAKDELGREVHGLQGLILIQFMDGDGDVSYRYLSAGEVPLSNTIGLIELVKAQILDEYLNPVGVYYIEDDDELG